MKDITSVKKKMFYKSDFLFLMCGIFLIFSACNSVSQNSEAKNNYRSEIPNLQNESAFEEADLTTNADVKPTNFKCENQTEQIKFKGISFQCGIPLISSVDAVEEHATPLEDEKHKPDYVRSRRIAFKLKGEYTKQHEESYSTPGIEIYPIDEFRQAYAKSKSLVNDFDEEIKTLQKIILRKTAKKEKLPRLPFYEGAPEILAHFKQIPFQNGKGILYLTQYTVDWAGIINNQKLSYIFQGITTNKKYYVLATFPITHKELPDSIYDRRFRGYEMTDTYFDEERRPDLYAAHQKYLASVENLLNKSKPGEFQPDLDLIEKTISSLEVNWKD